MELGRIHLYTGDGKGKTTAAIGLAARATGDGILVLMVQFAKGRQTGELNSLEKLGITVLRNSRDYGFAKYMTQTDREAVTRENTENLENALKMVENHFGMLILDELMSVYNNGLIDKALVREMMEHPPAGVELVLTGRDADPIFTERCDYLTEMCCKRHPFTKGITARKGIEY